MAREGRGRGIGTVLCHAVVTNGRILQGSAHVALAEATSKERREWRHYLRRQGVVEVLGSPKPHNIIDGYLADVSPARGLDLTSISDRIIDDVQQSDTLNHTTALRASTAVVRWAATLAPNAKPTVGIAKSDLPNFHVIRLSGAPDDLPMLIRFCEEFALHEWLLTTVQDVIVPRAETDIARDQDPLDSLLFALNELVPLWMPPTHLSPDMKASVGSYGEPDTLLAVVRASGRADPRPQGPGEDPAAPALLAPRGPPPVNQAGSANQAWDEAHAPKRSDLRTRQCHVPVTYVPLKVVPYPLSETCKHGSDF